MVTSLGMPLVDTRQSISHALSRFISGTALSRVSGLFREIAMAAAFGTDPAVAAFWMAFRFAYLLRRIFGEGALNMAFIPHFEALRREAPARAARFFFDLASGLTVVLLLIIFLVEGILGYILFFGEPTSANLEVIRLSMLLAPALLFICLYALNLALLQCEGTYFLPSAAPTCANLIWIGTVCLLWNETPSSAMMKLALIVVVALAMQWLVTMPAVYKFCTQSKMARTTFREKKKEIIALLRPFCFGLIGVAATQINSALDALFARAADPEGPAYLWYAIRIQQLPLAFFGVGMMGALLPPLTRAVQRQAAEEASQFLRFALRQSVLVMIPATIALIAFGQKGVSFLFGHGAFTAKGILETSQALSAYAIGLLPMSMVLIFATPFYAQKEFKTPMFASLIAVFSNVALNSLFVFGCGWGAVSVALATSLSSLINVLILLVSLKKKMPIVLEVASLRVLMCGLAAWGASYVLEYFLGPYGHKIAGICLQVIVFGVVFLFGKGLLLKSER